MERIKPADRGVTLLDLIISVVVATLVLFAASKLLINFGNFTYNFVKAETSLVGTAVGALEEIAGKITAANKVVLVTTSASPMDKPSTPFPTNCVAVGNASANCIQIRVDAPNTAANYDDDTVYTYYWNPLVSNQLFRAIRPDVVGTAIAKDIFSLNFLPPDATHQNQVKIKIEAKAKSGSVDTEAKENLETTATMRSRSAQVLT